MMRDRSTRAGLKICITCMAVQQLSGINNAHSGGVPPLIVVCPLPGQVQQLSGINNAFNFSSTFLAQVHPLPS